MTSASNPVTASNKKTITLSDESLGIIGQALLQRGNYCVEMGVLLASLGAPNEYFSAGQIAVEEALKEFYAALEAA